MALPVLKMATVSDIHFGHPRTRTLDLSRQFDEAFFADPANQTLDILYLAGDVWHQQLTLSNDDVHDIDRWAVKLLRYCVTYGIILRNLEGTPSHDRSQSKRFTTLIEILGLQLDYAYVSTISIEYIEKLDIHVLYVPDQPSIHPDTVLKTVDALMLEKGLEQVDYAIMHGHFKHQLPDMVKHPAHDLPSYMRRVRYLVFIGHVHLMTIRERAHAQGSFGRIAHGEENPKGYFRARVERDGTYEVTFVENRNATKYVTLDLTGKTLEDSLSLVDALTGQYPEDSHLRLRLDRSHPWASHFVEVQRRSPFFFWTKQIVDDRAPDVKVTEQVAQEYTAVILNAQTLPGAVKNRIRQRTTLSPDAWNLIDQYYPDQSTPITEPAYLQEDRP